MPLYLAAYLKSRNEFLLHNSISQVNCTMDKLQGKTPNFIIDMNKQSKFEITDEEVWYILVNSETRGPLSLRDLDVLLRTNDISSKTFAWKNGMKEWRYLNEIEEIKASILESSKEILEIEKKREHLFEKPQQTKETQNEQGEENNDQIIQNKDQNALTILESTVDNLIKKTFHQTTDGKWNIYDEEKGEWVQQDQEPAEKIEKMKQLLFSKLKTELFFGQKDKRRKKDVHAQEKVEPEVPLTEEQLLKKEKNKKKAKRQAEKKKEKWYSAKINTFIYISGLPLDITEEELKEFVNKAGVLRIDLNTGKQKVKIYKDQNGFPKGDAAVSYARQESVEMAIQNLNNKEIRSGFKVRIEKATFNQKQQDYKRRQTKKQSLAKKIQSKMQEKKQFSWDDNIDEVGQGLKIVILKHMIDQGQLNNDQYIESVKKDITEQINKVGEVQRIRFYETHPDGIVEVKFKRQKDAEECIALMNGRFFDGREVECDYWDGETDYKRDAGSIQLQQQRLQKYAQELEGGEGQDKQLQKIEQKAEDEDEQVINTHLLQDN